MGRSTDYLNLSTNRYVQGIQNSDAPGCTTTLFKRVYILFVSIESRKLSDNDRASWVRMKNLVIIAIVCLVGFVVHRIYTGSPQDTPTAKQATYDDLPSIPHLCEDQADTLEDAIYDHEVGTITNVELEQRTRGFQSCLRDAGFSDSQINRTYAGLKQGTLGEIDSQGGSDDDDEE